MDIKELTTEMNRFVTAKGWYESTSKRPQTPRNLAVSLSLEVAEVLEHFQWNETFTNSEEFKGELADVALYLPSACQCNRNRPGKGDLEQAADQLWQTVGSRISPGGRSMKIAVYGVCRTQAR